jgi:hypothetical protein
MTTDFAKKTSLRVAKQLPEFIRSTDDYQTFVSFVQAYYEWMEQLNIGNNKEGAIRGTHNLYNYKDIDFINPGETYNKFIEYYVQDFLPNFPKDALADKTKLVKIAKELYGKKGTPASYEFLFRALYNSDAGIYLTRDTILRASDGKWYVTKSLRLASNDENWFLTDNLRVFGILSKSIATIERAVTVGNRIEVYISNIQRLFQSGEDVIVVDNNNRNVYFKDGEIVPEGTSGSSTLSAKVLGSISSVNINPQKRGQLYSVGDPVVFHGGLREANGVGAIATISEVTSGSLRAIDVIDGGYGYRQDPNTIISITGGGGSGAIANVSAVDPATTINVNFIPSNFVTSAIYNSKIGGTGLVQLNVFDYYANATIITGNAQSTTGLTTGDTINIVGSNTALDLNGSYTVTVANANYFFIPNTNGTPNGTWANLANVGLTFKGNLNDFTFFPANTTSDLTSNLAYTLSFTAFPTYSIDVIQVNNGGGGYTSLPSIRALSTYDKLNSSGQKALLAYMGILGPINIVTPGTGYANGDIIRFVGGTGTGANATVGVNATGSITSVDYQYSNGGSSLITYPKGGFGYNKNQFPTLSIITSGGSGGQLNVNTILGDSAILEGIPDERGIGAITSFTIENFGEDYISVPSVSLRVRDLVVKNVSTSNLVKSEELVYQGTSLATSVFKANVDSIQILETDANPLESKYILRTYDYYSNTKTNLQLKVTDRESGPNIYMDLVNNYSSAGFTNGIKTYGNGAARATAKFLSGLIIGEGVYLNDDGFPSSYQILENEDFNNFSYQLIVEKSFEAYKEVLNALLHPSGTKVLPYNSLKSGSDITVHKESFASNNQPLSYYTSEAGSNASMFATFETPSNNIIKFGSLVGTNLENIIYSGAMVSLKSQKGPNVYSSVLTVSYVTDTVVIKDNVFLAFANVAIANVRSSNTQINISEITNQYDLINNGEYSNTQNKLQDIIFVNDHIRVVDGSNVANIFNGTVTYINYSNGSIFANTTISFNSNSALVSVRRNVTTTDVLIYNNLGSIYYPQLITENDELITTQDGKILILG